MGHYAEQEEQNKRAYEATKLVREKLVKEGRITGVCAPSTEFGEGLNLNRLSGEHHMAFCTGAQKDVAGKPRFDLIPPEAMKTLAETYALGAVKYSDRNWEKGIPFSVALGALKRHLNAFELGSMINTADGDIEHIAHVMWWAVALTTFVKRGRLDLNDLPHYNELV